MANTRIKVTNSVLAAATLAGTISAAVVHADGDASGAINQGIGTDNQSYSTYPSHGLDSNGVAAFNWSVDQLNKTKFNLVTTSNLNDNIFQEVTQGPLGSTGCDNYNAWNWRCNISHININKTSLASYGLFGFKSVACHEQAHSVGLGERYNDPVQDSCVWNGTPFALPVGFDYPDIDAINWIWTWSLQ